MTIKKILNIFSLILLVTNSTISQTFTNKIWQQQVANPSTYDNVATALCSSGNLITTANNFIGSAEQIHLNCINNGGNVVWQQNVTGSPNKPNFGVDVKTDAAGNIYCIGAYNSGGDYDYRIAKYTANGVLVWQKFYNGPPGNKDDVPTAMEIDNSGNVYVTGSSWGSGGALIDFATLKFDNNGNQLWVSRYDNGLIDAATSMRVDNSGNVFVTGASASNPNNANITTVKYSPVGAQLGVHSFNYPGNGKDLGVQIVLDFIGNVIVTGCVDNGTQHFVTFKLTNNLALSWSNVMSGNLSEGYSADTDNSGNVISVGYQNNTYGGSDMIVNKFSSGGSLMWQRKLSNPNPSNFAKARKVKTGAGGKIYVAADAQIGATRDFLTLGLDISGETTWAQYFNSPTNGSDIPSAIQVNGNDIYVTGITTNGSAKTLSSVRYSILDKDQPIVFNGTTPVRFQNELLVRFWPSAINPITINNKELTQGVLAEFLTPEAMLAVNDALRVDATKYPCYKVFPRMIMADSISITRSGRKIKILHHYTTLGIIFPTGSNDSINRITLNSLTKYVDICDYNHIVGTNATANDPEYTNGNSAALVTTTAIPNANINIEPAWDVTSGATNVKVGVFDSGINFAHQDFGNGTFVGSKIAGGFNYYNNIPLNMVSSNDLHGHGSAVGGIIGGLRNNNFGVAGVAGGDVLSSNTGVSLYDMEVFKLLTGNCTSSYAGDNAVVNAIVEGASSNTITSFGFGQHIQNHSWGGISPLGIVLDAFITAYDNEVVLSCSSGNQGTGSFTPGICAIVSYPNTWKDHIVMKVGANDNSGAKASFAECGFNLDFIAPGVNSLYTALDKNASGLTDFFNLSGCGTLPIDGTSFAAPHASGLAGLLISYANNTAGVPNKLFPEDCERLMQRFATDVTVTPNNPGYDNETGHGRINAGQTLQNFKFPDYMVKHYSFNVSAGGATLVGANEKTCLRNNLFSLPNGPTFVNRYEITGTTSHTLPVGYNFIEGWERCAGSNVFGINSVINPICTGSFPQHYIPDATNIITTGSISATNASFKGYIYEVLDNSLNTVGWYPFPPTGTVTFAYSLYLQSQSIGIEENFFTEHSVFLYPNPSSDQVYITAALNEIKELKIEVYSTLGQLLIKEEKLSLESGKASINVSSLSNGVYFFNLVFNNKKMVKKVIVNR